MAKKNRNPYPYHRFHELDWAVIFNAIFSVLNIVLNLWGLPDGFKMFWMVVSAICAIILATLYAQIY